jgi:hypothetical protein
MDRKRLRRNSPVFIIYIYHTSLEIVNLICGSCKKIGYFNKKDEHFLEAF